MTTPVGKKVQLSGYAQAQAGIIKNPINEEYSNIGIGVGGQLNYQSTYLRAGIQGGTAIGAEVKLGHEFNLGNNIGLDTYGTASYNLHLKQNEYSTGTEYKSVYHSAFNSEAEPYVYNEKYDFQGKWRSGEKRLGVGAQLTYKAKNIKLGIGLEGGTRSTTTDKNLKFEAPTTDIEYIENNDFTGEQVRTQHHFEFSDSKEVYKKSGYLTATASIDGKVSKNLNLFANGRLNQGVEAGVRWTF